jgi:hypothetical protein
MERWCHQYNRKVKLFSKIYLIVDIIQRMSLDNLQHPSGKATGGFDGCDARKAR